MRVNHHAQLCAQALHQAQAVMARDDSLATSFVECAQAKEEHLKWCEVRLQELNGQTSVLNPIGYASSFSIGILVGLLGDKISLGFLAQNQDQIVSQLEKHTHLLPPQDTQSRSILQHIQKNELAQATQSELATHSLIPQLMHSTSWAINKVTYYI
jgi:ubiquinone biosynthesis monooxygenase Coq7